MPRSAVEVCVWVVEENDRGHESGDKTDGDRLDTDPARRSAWGFAKCEKGHSDRATGLSRAQRPLAVAQLFLPDHLAQETGVGSA